LACGTFLAATAAAQTTTAKPYTAPRTVDGQPDLQGVWDYRTITPLERPDGAGNKAAFSDEEAEVYQKQQEETRNRDRRDGTALQDLARAYNEFWWDYGRKVAGGQTSLIIDPPDGKIPALSPEGTKRQEAAQARTQAIAAANNQFASYENRPLGERCIAWGVAGPPMAPGAYNNNVQIFQSKDWVVIYNEMIHEHRMVPLDGRPPLSSAFTALQGESRGHWDGDTLVVVTTNFAERRPFRGSTPNMRLTERFTRVADDTLLYEYTVEDPATWTRPWTARIPMVLSPEPVYEYACHEGNYAIPNALSSERNNEKLAAAAAQKGSN
jgi:hypothetical protein